VKWERIYEAACCLVAACLVAGVVTLALWALVARTQEIAR